MTDFYNWYLDEVRRGHSPWMGGELAKRPEVSHGFAVRLENAKEPEPGNDPILSTDETPGSLEITDAKVSAFDATVAVRLGTGDASRFVNVRLVRSDDIEPWQIDDVQPVLVGNRAQTPVPAPTPDINLSQRIQLAETRLNAVYGQLRGRLDARRKALLKQEEVEWIKRKDALPGNDFQRVAMIERRIEELSRWDAPHVSDANRAAGTATPAGPLLQLKIFENENHTCRLLLPEDGWVPVEFSSRGTCLALEGPGGIRLSIRRLEAPVGNRSLAVMFSRETKERFPYDNMEIKPTDAQSHSTAGKRSISSFSAQSSDPTQRMLQDMPDGPMKQGMLSAGAGADPMNITLFVWAVISEGSSTWIVEVEGKIPLGTPAEIRRKTDRSREQVVRQFNLTKDFQTNPVWVYAYIRGRTIGKLAWDIERAMFDAEGLTSVIDFQKQVNDPETATSWNQFMNVQTW